MVSRLNVHDKTFANKTFIDKWFTIRVRVRLGLGLGSGLRLWFRVMVSEPFVVNNSSLNVLSVNVLLWIGL